MRPSASRLSRLWGSLAITAIVAATLAPTTARSAVAASSPYTQWPMGGQNYLNSRSNPFETTIGPANAASLAPKWTFTTHGDVSATPAVVNGVVYFPDFGGYLNAVDASTGALLWQRPISSYDGESGWIARTSPAVSGGTLYIGDYIPSNAATGTGAHLMAINAATGALQWITTLDTNPYAVDTQSPVVYNGAVYVGVASLQEGASSYNFRGSMMAVNATTGAILWKTYTISDADWAAGYTGAAIWGSTPAIDLVHNAVDVTTGNNYSVPQSVLTCESAGGTAARCDDPNDHIDAIMALDLGTGAIKWATGLQTFDAWNVTCFYGASTCPAPTGPDYDFGSGANLFSVATPNGPQEIVGAGEKSGDYWELDASSGRILRGTHVGPGSTLGGIEWGTATDGSRIYFGTANDYQLPYTIPTTGETICSGSIGALDPNPANTQPVLWQIRDPDGQDAVNGQCTSVRPYRAFELGPVTVANGVVYEGSMTGKMYALNAATGTILATMQGQGSSNAGAAVVNGVVYWGNGYARFGLGSGSTTFYAFSPGGH